MTHMVLIIKPDVGHRHPVLGESPSLVRTNDRGGAQRLNRFQIFHQAIFGGHAVCSECQTNRYSGLQT